MKTFLSFTLSLLCLSAFGQTNGVIASKSTLKSVVPFTNIVFSPPFKDTNYFVTIKDNPVPESAPSKVLWYKTNSFRLKCSPGATNVAWSVIHR